MKAGKKGYNLVKVGESIRIWGISTFWTQKITLKKSIKFVEVRTIL